MINYEIFRVLNEIRVLCENLESLAWDPSSPGSFQENNN